MQKENDRFTWLFRFTMFLGICGALLIFNIGCDSAQLGQLLGVRQKVGEARNATTQTIADQQQAISTLSANDPARKALESAIAKEQAAVNKADDVLAKADAAIRALQSGDASGIGPLLSGIPVVGPYAGLIVSLGLLGWKWKKASETHAALAQTVNGLDNAGELTATQKSELAAAQDSKSKVIVAAIKAAN